QVKRVIVLVGVEILGTRNRRKRSGKFALARQRERQIVQNLRKIGTAHHIQLQIRLELNEDFLGFVGLVEAQVANTGRKNRFDTAFVGRGHAGKPRQGGSAIVAREICLGKRKRRVGPVWLLAHGFL